MIKKISFLLCSTILLCSKFLNAQEINLSGIVQNKSGNRISGAEIKIAKHKNFSAVTDSEGKFELTGKITAVNKKNSSKLLSSASFKGMSIQLILNRAVPVKVAAYSISGRKAFEFNSEVLHEGLNVLAFPMNRFSAGVYLISVAYEDKVDVFRYASPSPNNGAYSASLIRSDFSPSVLSKSAAADAAIDTLLVEAEGYISTSYPIESYKQNDIVIELEKISISRLDNITKECGDGVKPGPVSGGKSGWGSRYWDCCKPHCSWPEKTKHFAANCGIDGKTQIPCFKEVGDGNWSSLQGTRSGCDSDGEAYMCYSHVPFAVCKELAMGFAAVPAEGDPCGRCFQIDFDGGFRHGEAKESHKLLKGKTMIVMASNVGHDVGGGQFDLMIPGGGLGIFKDGCSKQWKVNVSDEGLVGKTYGGFTSTCQEKLGWDAGADEIKLCVRSMCDNLFGDKPELSDLYEGCIWYVEWMHAVDNPTFTYKEVECPMQLIDLYYSALHPRPSDH